MRRIKIGCNDALDAGIYTFTFGNGSKVRARYTFTYVLDLVPPFLGDAGEGVSGLIG